MAPGPGLPGGSSQGPFRRCSHQLWQGGAGGAEKQHRNMALSDSLHLSHPVVKDGGITARSSRAGCRAVCLLSPLPAPARVLRGARLPWDIADPRCHTEPVRGADGGSEEPSGGWREPKVLLPAQVWGEEQGTPACRRKEHTGVPGPGLGALPPAVLLPTQLRAVTFLSVGYVRLPMAFVFLIPFVAETSVCKLLLGMLAELLSFPSSPHSLVTHTTWARQRGPEPRLHTTGML